MLLHSAELSSCLESTERHFRHIMDELVVMQTLLVEVFDRGPVDSVQAIVQIEAHVKSFLDTSGVIGAGYVASRGALSDLPLYLAWWQGDDRRLLAEPGAPANGDPLDYTRHPWFRAPERTGGSHITGPYVDFVCTDEYVMTSTTPVHSHGHMVGVVGADTLVESLESMLLPQFRAAGATLVNEHGRTVVSSDPHRATGSLLTLDECREVIACRDVPLSVVIP